MSTKKLQKMIAEAAAEAGARRFSSAAKLYRKVLREDPWNLDGHYLLGSLLAEQGDTAGAERHLGIAAELKPDSPYVWNNLGSLRKLGGDIGGALGAWIKAIELKPDLAEAWVNIGQIHLGNSKWAEAEDCLRRAVAIKEMAPAWNGLAGLAEQRGDIAGAIDCCRRALAIRPDDGTARFALARLEGRPLSSAPRDMVRSLFDDYAGRFDSHLTQQLAYATPGKLAAVIAAHAPASRFDRAADLGCGTGLMGQALGDRVRELVGVDLSPRMLEQARKRNIYRRLVAADLIEFLDAEKACFDLLLAADVLVYMGGLEDLFAAAFRRACAGALFAFSTEISSDQPWQLKPSGRYAHSPAFVRQQLEAAGWDLLTCEETSIRLESDKPVAGGIFLAARRQGAAGSEAAA